jgi:hypothetical protein
MNQLAVSVGGRVLISRAGTADDRQAGLAASVCWHDSDAYRHGAVLSASVSASDSEGWCADWYCKNWTVQTGNIAAGVLINHADMYAQSG